MNARHIVLAGDSIFDNDGYVPGEPGVIEQMRRSQPPSWSACKVAIDGACIGDILEQLANLPANATDLIVSAGGNDVLQYEHLLTRRHSHSSLLAVMAGPLAGIRADYRDMLAALAKLEVRSHVCTIYTAIPFDDPILRQHGPEAIAALNAVIIEEAASSDIPVLRLDHVCTEELDFAEVSPIEPSAQGGQKIVDYILSVLA